MQRVQTNYMQFSVCVLQCVNLYRIYYVYSCFQCGQVHVYIITLHVSGQMCEHVIIRMYVCMFVYNRVYKCVVI